MVSDIDDGVLICRGNVVNPQSVVMGQRVGRRDREIAWIAFLAIAAQVAQNQLGPLFRDRGALHRPDNFIKSDLAPMEGILAIVGRESIGLSTEVELPTSNSIAITADQGPEIRTLFEVLTKDNKPQYHVGETAFAIRSCKGKDY